MKKIVFVICFVFMMSIYANANSDIAQQAREIVKNNGDAVVSINAVIELSTSYGGETSKRESKRSANGVIINSNGLIATSISSLNPSEGFSSIMMDFESDYSQTSDFKDIKVRMSDGTEVNYDVKLNDKDFDLMFLIPKTASDKEYPYINMNDNSTADLMDTVILLNRMGLVGSYSIAVNPITIQAVIEKPRKFYSSSAANIWGSTGGPVFTVDGKFLGLVLTMSSPSAADTSSWEDFGLPIILPAENIIKSAEHVEK